MKTIIWLAYLELLTIVIRPRQTSDMHYLWGQFLGYNRLFEIVIAMKFRFEELSDIEIVNDLDNMIESHNLIALPLPHLSGQGKSELHSPFVTFVSIEVGHLLQNQL